MSISIPSILLKKIKAHGEEAYPEEGAGLLLGREDQGQRTVTAILPLENTREEGARHNRYLISAEEMLRGEKTAARQGVSIIGIFHSHPDHPDQPSEYDRAWAIPWYSYLITRIDQGQAAGSRSWRLAEDRSAFIEEEIHDKNLT